MPSDRRYQEFMAQRIEPLCGQCATSILRDLGSPLISVKELMLNRQMALSGLALVNLVRGTAACSCHLVDPAAGLLHDRSACIEEGHLFYTGVVMCQRSRR